MAYVQPSSSAPPTVRYAVKNPNRRFKHHQLQVILKPLAARCSEPLSKHLAAIGLDLSAHDVRFEEDNWEAPTLGAWGARLASPLGWPGNYAVFTYFQQVAVSIWTRYPPSLTYGLDRIALIYRALIVFTTLRWSDDRSYGQVKLLEEQEFSAYKLRVRRQRDYTQTI